MISAKSAVSFHLTMPAEKATSLLDKGQPTRFEPGELHIEGSPLFEEIASSGVILHFKRETIASLMIIEDRTHRTLIASIPTRIESGSSEYRITAELEDKILSISFSGSINESPGQKTMHFASDFSSWEGKVVQTLPYLHGLGDLVDAVTRRSDIVFQVDHKGNRLFGGRVTAKSLEKLRSAKWYFDALRKWRDLCILTQRKSALWRR